MVATAINNASVAASPPRRGLGVTKPNDMIVFGDAEDKNSLLKEDHNNSDRRQTLLNTQYYTQEDIDGYVATNIVEMLQPTLTFSSPIR